jgi:hypothetical protein
MMMKKILLLPLLWLLGAMPALSQTTPFSTYVLGLAAITSPTGAEKMVAISGGTPKTLTPNQILAFVSGDCTIAAPPSIVCTKTGGVSFAASATTNTTSATNISSGTLGLARLALTSAHFYVGNGSTNPADVAMSGDCTLAATGAVTCTKTNAVAFATSATTDTTNATNIASGTLASARYAAANLASAANGGVTGVLPFANMPTGSLDTVLGYWSTTTLSATAMPNCTTGALRYNTATHVFSCNVGAGSGTVTSITAGTGLSGGTITSTGTIALAGTNQTLQANPTNPAGTSATSPVMMGLGATCNLTPTYGTRVLLQFNGTYTNNVATASVSATARFGTGTAPANSAGATGTTIGPIGGGWAAVAGTITPFFAGGIITGLTPSTAYWFDLGVSVSTGFGSVGSIGCTAMEF